MVGEVVRLEAVIVQTGEISFQNLLEIDNTPNPRANSNTSRKRKVAHAEILTSTPYKTELSTAKIRCTPSTSKITNKSSVKKKLKLDDSKKSADVTKKTKAKPKLICREDRVRIRKTARAPKPKGYAATKESSPECQTKGKSANQKGKANRPTTSKKTTSKKTTSKKTTSKKKYHSRKDLLILMKFGFVLFVLKIIMMIG